MVPDIAKKGTSFKGAFNYYLHDKRKEGEAKRDTAERVAWTETRNLGTDDPETANRVMIATARNQDALKEAAGVKATGRKSPNVVYAYSLAWHPDEKDVLTNKPEMMRAAEQSLEALGASHLQAVIVCHNECKHPHVHIILNRVDPATGKMHGFSNDRHLLSEWANKYERERGQILTAERERKRLERESRDQEERRKYMEDRKAAYEREEARRTKAQHLRELGKAQKIHHQKEWVDFAASAKARRQKIYDAAQKQIAEALARHKAETKGIWREYFKEVRAEQRAFAKREKTVTGKIRNALHAAAQQKRMGDTRGTLALTFANVFSSQQRAAAFAQRQDMTRQVLASKLKAILDLEVRGIKDHRKDALSADPEERKKARQALVDRQSEERAKLREAWRQLYPDKQGWQKRKDRASTLSDQFDMASGAEPEKRERTRDRRKHSRIVVTRTKARGLGKDEGLG